MNDETRRMYQKTYKIKKTFLAAFSIDVFLLFLLFMMAVFLRGASSEKIILAIMFIIILFIYIETRARKVLTGDQGILIKKFLREKELRWDEITQVGIVVLRKRVYLLLTTTKGFHILTNAYEAFTGLLIDIAGHVERERVEEDVRKLIEHPLKRIADTVSMWFAGLVLVAIIALKLINH